MLTARTRERGGGGGAIVEVAPAMPTANCTTTDSPPTPISQWVRDCPAPTISSNGVVVQSLATSLAWAATGKQKMGGQAPTAVPADPLYYRFTLDNSTAGPWTQGLTGWHSEALTACGHSLKAKVTYQNILILAHQSEVIRARISTRKME